jgi:thiamine biosynthesis protein ThiS
MTIEIILNGEACSLPKEHNLQDLIETLGLSGQAVLISVNLQLISHRQWKQRQLKQQDRVDIVHAIGAG